jgi:predicted PurR-regulated permease PerM
MRVYRSNEHVGKKVPKDLKPAPSNVVYPVTMETMDQQKNANQLEPAQLIPRSESPHWNRNTKLVVSVAGLLLVVFAVFQFSALIQQVVIAAMLAYVLRPIVDIITEHTPLRRGTSILVTYLLFLTSILIFVTFVGFVAVDQVTTLWAARSELIETATELFAALANRTYTIFGYDFSPILFDIESLGIELTALIEQMVTTIASRTSSFLGGAAAVAFSTVSALATFLIIFIMSIYIMNDVPMIGRTLEGWAATPGYRADMRRLWFEFGLIWRAYLRGQLILALTMGVVTWAALAAIGVQNAVALGILAGTLEFLPVIGPFISGAVAVIVAIFQASNSLGLNFWQFALVVTVIMLILQQLENSILVPRIVGQALNLSPLLTLVAVFMGSSLAGILGAVLAAPVTATVKLLATYAWRKLFDQEPFPDLPLSEPKPQRHIVERLRRRFQGMSG